MSRFALLVTLKVSPNSCDKFLPLIMENRRLSLEREQGCRKFIVLRNSELGDTFHFYEEYDNLDAFKAHQNSEHFKNYYNLAKDMMLERVWKKCDVLEE